MCGLLSEFVVVLENYLLTCCGVLRKNSFFSQKTEEFNNMVKLARAATVK